ncbi:Ig-like domain repeat protein [Rhodococcus sp. NPDC003318]|uniref:Ig-like domain repeat protein n=1 Tax=Rhodococcus sp. NPDC003318 TaxID=3364503 RepID=UPI0036BD70FC
MVLRRQRHLGGLDKIPALAGDLVPGGEATSTFYARNDGTSGGRLQVYLGNWSTSENTQAYVRAEINDARGQRVDLVNNLAEPGTELSSIHLAPGEWAKVMLVVDMLLEAGNETQNGSIDPDFALDFEHDAEAVATTTTVSALATTATGTSVELTATVAPADATGTVQFTDGDTSIGAPVTVAAGTAVLNHPFTTAGAHEITAVHSGDTGFATSTSAAFTVTVTAAEKVPTSIAISGADAVVTGTNMELTATVVPNAATGSVQFRDDGVALGSPIAVVDGVATTNRSFNTDGVDTITAEYLGSGVHAAHRHGVERDHRPRHRLCRVGLRLLTVPTGRPRPRVAGASPCPVRKPLCTQVFPHAQRGSTPKHRVPGREAVCTRVFTGGVVGDDVTGNRPEGGDVDGAVRIGPPGGGALGLLVHRCPAFVGPGRGFGVGLRIW